MRITANQVTFVRLLLLPVPVAMVYQGGVRWMLGALAVYVLLGLTDAIDGILARRYGSTPLGALLDPIADKIFLVAAYIPLADHRIVSIGLVSAMFVRELAVTVLRTVALEEKVVFRTSRIAKLKTTVQMAGAGFLLLIWLFPADRVIWSILGVAAVLSLVPGLISVARAGQPGWRAIWAGILIVAIAVTRLLLSRGWTLSLLMAVVLTFTVLSGLEYVWKMRAVLVARFRRSPLEAIRLAGLSLAAPVLLLPAAELPAAPVFAIMGVLAAELAVGGLDNSLAHAGAGRGPWPDLLRSGAQAIAGTVLLIFLPGSTPWVSLVVWLALTITLADLAVRFVRNIEVFRVANAHP